MLVLTCVALRVKCSPGEIIDWQKEQGLSDHHLKAIVLKFTEDDYFHVKATCYVFVLIGLALRVQCSAAEIIDWQIEPC